MIRILCLGCLLASWALHADNRLKVEQAERLAQLPLDCIQTEYPNKLGQVLGRVEHLGEPRELHPAFYGCFDWHSSVHGHWSLVRLLRSFPDLPQSDVARRKLLENINPENIEIEIQYFQRDTETSYERTYGWAWLLKLAEELRAWDDPLAAELLEALQPLVDLIVQRYIEYYPKLVYPIRVGEHSNSAFGASFAWDYAVAAGHSALRDSLAAMARRFYLADRGCPIDWEPSGYDFLSPCLEEVDLMRRVLPRAEFLPWLGEFLPELFKDKFSLQPGRVIDRTDGKLVHLDGLNFSRAWVLYGLADQYPELDHLRSLADEHLAHSLPNLVGDSYEGGHWLGSFAIYALETGKRLGFYPLPELPEAVSNNAVAEVTVDGVQYMMSFMGLGDGKTHDDIHRNAWLWRSDTGRWENFPPVPVDQGRLASVAVGVHDRILLLGGYTVAEDGQEVSTPEVFLVDPVSQSYQRRADMPLPVDDTVAMFHANRYVYLVSGWHDDGNVANVQLYDTWQDRWQEATAFPGVPVFGHAGGIVDGEMIIVGGVGVLGEKDGKRQFGAIDQAWKGTVDPEDPGRIDWRPLPGHPGTDRYRMAASGADDLGLVVFAGGTARPYNFNGIGYDGEPAEPVDEVFAWDLPGDNWVDFPDLARSPTMDHRGLLRLQDGRFLTLGGMRGGQQVMADLVPFELDRGSRVGVTTAVQHLMNSLETAQLARIRMDFNSEERLNWHFIPRSRKGLPLNDMNERQKALALGLLQQALSARGYEKADGVRLLEKILGEIEERPDHRDHNDYYFSVFGEPGSEPWGWRFEGHHVSLNFTVIREALNVSTPAFFGANPARVPSGPHSGFRLLAAEEDLARQMVLGLDEAQRAQAIIMDEAPRDIFNVPGRNETVAQGIAWAELTGPQQQGLLRLIEEYLGNLPKAEAERNLEKLKDSGLEGLHFAWAGALEPGEPHYYRVQSGGFVLEYDNIQNGANHVHSLWRHFEEDFGADALGEHYRTSDHH